MCFGLKTVGIGKTSQPIWQPIVAVQWRKHSSQRAAYSFARDCCCYREIAYQSEWFQGDGDVSLNVFT